MRTRRRQSRAFDEPGAPLRENRPTQRVGAYFDRRWSTQADRFRCSSRAAIAMMQTADFRYGDHLSFRRMLDSTWHRCVAFQRKMSA